MRESRDLWILPIIPIFWTPLSGAVVICIIGDILNLSLYSLKKGELWLIAYIVSLLIVMLLYLLSGNIVYANGFYFIGNIVIALVLIVCQYFLNMEFPDRYFYTVFR